jgi:uncharacterized protein (TIGR00255 family)
MDRPGGASYHAARNAARPGEQMLRSMTAYARAGEEAAWGQATWELRSVNNRYLDVSFRLPEEMRPLEGRFRERVAARLGRGKVECGLRLTLAAGGPAAISVDRELAGEVVRAADALAALAPRAEALRLGELLRWPGIVQQAPPDPERVEAPVLTLLERALDDLTATREREGERIREMVEVRCAAIETIVAAVRERQPALVHRARERLRERLAELLEKLDPERVEQEIVVVATKLDVSEEMDRLDAHVAEVRSVLRQSEPVGRRLDFLMQELNREANTLGSKAADAESTRASVDLKVLIEQIREQIQNVE